MLSGVSTAFPIDTIYGPRMPWTVRRVCDALRVGFLVGDDHHELIEGELIEMPPVAPDHANRRNVLGRRLQRALGERAFVAYTNPVVLGELSRPQPDLLVLPGEPEDYLGRDPIGKEAWLAVEITDTSHRRDKAKGNVYAAGGVPEYWIVDLPARTIHVFRGPTADGYALRVSFGLEESVAVPGTSAVLPVNGVL